MHEVVLEELGAALDMGLGEERDLLKAAGLRVRLLTPTVSDEI